jgi:phosphatidylglycerol:prolipoprotein diacylglycerol transferase
VKRELGVGPVEVPAYLALLLLGFLFATWYLRRQGERRGLDGPSLVDLALVALVAGVIGARALAVLTDGRLADFVHLCTDPARVEAASARVRLCTTDAECGFDYLCDPAARELVHSGARATMCHPPRDCLATLKFWQGGLTFYGGLLLALPVAIWFARRRGLAVLVVLDLAAPALMLGHALGKIGCFLEGCCYGAPTTSPLGVHFPALAGTVHPTQLYESAAAAVLFVVLHRLVRRLGAGRGEVLGWMLALYAVWRTGLELLRADPRGSLGPLSTAQLISIPLAAAGVALIVWARSRRAPILPP